MLISEIKPNEYDAYYGKYIKCQQQNVELLDAFKTGETQVISFFSAIPHDKLTYQYEPGKWTVKEVFQHMIDTERIFAHRCFRIARRDTTPLPGYEQDDYMAPALANAKSLANLLNEFKSGRQFTIALIESLSDDDLMALGTASGNGVSARALAGIIVGHDNWHLDVIKEKYL